MASIATLNLNSLSRFVLFDFIGPLVFYRQQTMSVVQFSGSTIIKMSNTTNFYNDPVWKKLNPVSFTYAGKGVDMLKGDADITSLHPRQGFITLYATSAVEEDKAEVFAYLFTAGLYQ